MALTIETVPITDLTPHPSNPRRGDVATIAESLTANGQFKPIVIATDGTVLAGNHTFQAAKSLGWDAIDAVRLDVAADSPEARKIMLADNRASDLGSYDDADLLAVLASLDDDLIGTGYLVDDLTDLQHLTQMRDVTAGEEGSRYDGTALATDGVIPDKGLQGLADEYAAKAIRSVILAYNLDDFDEVTRLMARAREVTGAESNADAILMVLRDL